MVEYFDPFAIAGAMLVNIGGEWNHEECEDRMSDWRWPRQSLCDRNAAGGVPSPRVHWDTWCGGLIVTGGQSECRGNVAGCGGPSRG